MKLFLDAGVLIAAASPRDPDHGAAVAVYERIADRDWRAVHTSDFVLAEALNYARMKLRRLEAVEAVLAPVFGRDDTPPLVTSVLRVHGGRFAASLERFRRDFDHGLSFTDCSSLVLMEEERIGEIATFDRAFSAFVDVLPGARAARRRAPRRNGGAT